MAKEWLKDAYDGEYGHNGCCAVCTRGWFYTPDSGPSHNDIFPLDGQRKAPKLFHLACLEKAQLAYKDTWLKYQHWKATGEV